MLSPVIPFDLLNKMKAGRAIPAPSLAPNELGDRTLIPAITRPRNELGAVLPMQNDTPDAPAAPHIPTAVELDQQRVNDLHTQGSGIDQIKNPLLRGIARAGDITASVFGSVLPVGRALDAAIPGTTLHHQVLTHRAERTLANDQASQKAAADVSDVQSQIGQRDALTEQEKARAEALRDPRKAVDPSKTVQTDDGVYQLNPVTGKYDIRVGDRVEKPKPIEEQAYEYAVQSGKNPLDAYSAVYGAKNTKTDNLPQQYLDAIASGDAAKANLIKRTIHDTQVAPKIEVHNAVQPPSGIPPSTPGHLSPMVQAIIDGRAPAPTARSKQAIAIMEQVMAADPTYDQSRYNTYQAMQKEATVGKTGQAINSLNTIQEHVARALQNIPDNTGNATLNWLKNKGEEAIGQNPTGKFEVDATGIAGEWAKLVAGGVASEAEQKHVQALLSPNASPQKMRDNLAEVKAMTDGKLAGIQKQVESAVHPGAGSNYPTSLPGAYKMTATGPNGHKIGSNDGGNTWVDIQTGKAIQ